MAKENFLFAFIGVAAAGKTELARHLCKNHGFVYLPSITTRPKREGNLDEYHHVSVHEFEDLVKNDKLLEYTIFNDHYYGKLKEDFYSLLEKSNVAYVITADRIEELKKFHPRTVVICAAPQEPMLKTIEKRLLDRTVHPDENLLRKLKTVENDLIHITDLETKKLIDRTITTFDDDHSKAFSELDKFVKSIV